MTQLGWGIIGTGTMGHIFCRDFVHVALGTVRGIVSRQKDTAQAFAQQYGITTPYTELDHMLEDPSIHAVYIASPHSCHIEQGLRALDAGKAVLCEKPLTVNSTECLQLQKKARDTQCYLMEALWTYFLPALQTAKQWVLQGRIGEVTQVKADFGFAVPYNPTGRLYAAELGGGTLLDMGVYPVAIARYFFEKDPISVKALGHFASTGVDDEISAILSYDNSGKQSAIIGSSFRAHLANAAVVIGTEGYIVIPDAFRCRECTLYQGDKHVEHFKDTVTLGGYEHQAKSVCEDILAGKIESTTVPFNSTLGFQKTMDAINVAIRA